MNVMTLRVAIAEAKRFLSKANVALDHIEAGNDYDRKFSASAKRASMDLTRVLADMRRRPS